jgi:hypothetical protein
MKKIFETPSMEKIEVTDVIVTSTCFEHDTGAIPQP